MLKMKNNEHPLIQRAFQWAEHWHRNQKRNSGQPYIVHPVSVANKVSQYTKDPTVIAAALCHDVREDCKEVTFNILVEKTNLSVATIVEEVTDPKLPFIERLAWRLAKVPDMSDGAKLIKVADIDDNMTDPNSYPVPHRLRFYMKNRIAILKDIGTVYSFTVADRLQNWIEENGFKYEQSM